MISIIVPVYNVEPYLRTCLNSIIEQTYRDLEIIVIEDGSTDNSGAICDEYAERDSRIRVIHTKNRGLSAARNLGLENARGHYIGFVDSDDWIEPDMYEILHRKSEETGADVVECGWFLEYKSKTEEQKKQVVNTHGIDALNALVKHVLSDNVWNKIWKKDCFLNIRFPVGRIYEDIATTYKVYSCINLICSIEESKYHYRQRKTSLTKDRSMDNLLGRWLSHKERYDHLRNCVDEDSEMIMLEACGEAIARTWSNYYGCAKADRRASIAVVRQMNDFAKEKFPLFGYKEWGVRQRVGIFFSHFLNPFSFGISFILDKAYKCIFKKKRTMDET